MKFTTSLICAIFMSFNFCIAQSISAKELLSKSKNYHDPDGKMLTSTLTFDFIETRPGGKDRTTTVIADVNEETFRLLQNRDSVLIDSYYDKGDIIFKANGSEEIDQEVKDKFRLNNDRFLMMRNYYQYLWMLPIKLDDPGTIIHDEISMADFFGTKSLQMKVTYDPEVGKDIWYFYFDPNTYAMVGYRFYKNEAANDGEYILLKGEQESNGVRIPKTRKWYMHKDDKYLGADILDGFWVE